MRNYINMTPHAICMNDGRVFAPSGYVVRVSSRYSAIVDDVTEVIFGDVEVIEKDSKNVVEFVFDANATYIVSAMCVQKCRAAGINAVAPATGHPEAVRNDKGQVASVPCFSI